MIPDLDIWRLATSCLLATARRRCSRAHSTPTNSRRMVTAPVRQLGFELPMQSVSSRTRQPRGRCTEGRPSIGTLEARTGAPQAAPSEYSNPTPPANAGLSVASLKEDPRPTIERYLPTPNKRFRSAIVRVGSALLFHRQSTSWERNGSNANDEPMVPVPALPASFSGPALRAATSLGDLAAPRQRMMDEICWIRAAHSFTNCSSTSIKTYISDTSPSWKKLSPSGLTLNFSLDDLAKSC